VRQGSNAYNISRIQRYLKYGDGTHNNFARQLLREAQSLNVKSFASFYRTRRLFELPAGWPNPSSAILR